MPVDVTNSANDFAGPRTPTEELVAGVWCELLELEEVAVTDNFFEVGGHSMVAVQVVYQLCQRTGVELPLESFFDLGTVAEVAAALDRAGAVPPDESLIYEGEL